MKSFQLRLSDNVYKVIKDIADKEETSIADVVRKSLELYSILSKYLLEDKKVFIYDLISKEKIELFILGLGDKKSHK